MLSRKSARWLIAGMTKDSTEQARLPIREMKKPKPGTKAAAAATQSTRAARQARNTAHRRGEGTLCRNQACVMHGRVAPVAVGVHMVNAWLKLHHAGRPSLGPNPK